MAKAHTFHIPVMGIGYTIDSPLKVSRFGIDSVISLGDDILMEKLRKMYCSLYTLPYSEITNRTLDFRAQRITSYLNLMKELAEKKFEEFLNASAEMGSEIMEYIDMLPSNSAIRSEFQKLTAEYFDFNKLKNWLRENLTMGSIDVNIMTKIDKGNYHEDEILPAEYNDAHAALRGFAHSELSASMVLSAGMNPRLYSYIEHFEDFYPDSSGRMKKKIILKVSDYRSAFIQGKFLAKKGLWVSEYRIESGLNCGGHAFATEGFLLGPILAEFRDKRTEMLQAIFQLFNEALEEKGRIRMAEIPEVRFTAQGGVGTAEEHEFLLQHYQLNSVGWGSPFLLVPEATSIDSNTLDKLAAAKEEDLYLSGISPLGVPFNNLRGNTKDLERDQLIRKKRPGSSCPKKYLSLNSEFTEKPICTGSRQYMALKLKELDLQNLPARLHQKEYNKIVEKSCICVGLGTSALLVHGLDTKVEHEGVSVCPGPNIAYFSKVMTLKEITDHIYGRANVITRTDRPNMFIKELSIYIDYFQSKLNECRHDLTEKQGLNLEKFAANLESGITYYTTLFKQKNLESAAIGTNFFEELATHTRKLSKLKAELNSKALN